MSSAKLMFLLLALFSIVSTLCGEKTQDTYNDGLSPPNACANCTLCQYRCHAQPPPPPPPSGYQSYGAPPPPPSVKVNCPPSAPVQCCQYASPMPYYYYPYSNYSGSSYLVIKPSTSPWFSATFFISFIFLGFEV